VSDEKGTLQLVAEQMALAVRPLRYAVADADSFRAFMYALGWDVASLPPAYAALATAVDDALAAVDTLGTAPDVAQIQALLQKVRAVYDAIGALTVAPAGTGPEFLTEIGERLFEYLLVEYLAAAHPGVFGALGMLGVIVLEPHASAATRPPYVRRRIRYDEVPRIVADPLSIPERVYGWGTPDFDFTLLAYHLLEVAAALGLFPAINDAPDEAAGYLDPATGRPHALEKQLQFPIFSDVVADQPVELGINILKLPAEGPKLPGILIQPAVPQELGTEFAIDDDVTLRVRAGSDVASRLGLVIRPGEVLVRYPFQPTATLPSAGFAVSLEYAPASARTLLGNPTGSRLQVAGAAARLFVDSHAGLLDAGVEVAANGLAVVLAAGEQDGFLNKLFGGRDVTAPLPLTVRWSKARGFQFAGGVGFEVTFAPHLQLGPITVEQLQLGVRATAATADYAADLRVEVGAAIAGVLGPIAFATDGIGVRLITTFEDGNAGPFDIAVGFKPPTGIGLVVDAKVVKGGGFLALDVAKGEYAGVVELSLKDKIQLKAIGILTTKLPDGSPGFSLLLIITAQFKPIQLGFGFTLTGVGGLIGVNRTMELEVLRAGIRNRTLDSVMFPADPVQNAATIISDLKAVLPPAEGRFVVGPMLEIGWPTPTLVTARIGVLVELPAPLRVVILGQIKALLPTPDEVLVRIQLDAMGVIEFEQKRLAVDATLYDSDIVGYPLAGDMALRLTWAEPRNLALAVGGFNPRFRPPPGFPTLRPLTLTLGTGNNPRLSLDAYFALTSNTAQVGAHLDVRARGGGFAVHGFLGFDALFVFRPFSFVADMEGSVDLLRGSSRLMAVRLKFTLTGPRPWRARGKATVSFLFFSVSVHFDVSWGDPLAVLLEALDALAPLLAALADPRNWSGVLPRDTELGASLAEATPGPSAVLVHPLGRATVRQTVAPLNTTLTKFGAAPPSGANHFAVSRVALNGVARAFDAVEDHFAPAQFKEMSDADALASPSYALMDAGVAAGTTGFSAGTASTVEVLYSTQIIDNVVLPATKLPSPYRPTAAAYLAMVRQGAAARSLVRTTGDAKFVTPGAESAVAMAEPAFVIATTDDLRVRADLSGGARGGREWVMRERLARYLAAHPGERAGLQVIPRHEAVAA